MELTGAPSPENLIAKYGMTNGSLALRKEFVRLSKDSAVLLSEKIPWIENVAPAFASEFYEWQCTFGRTRDFLSSIARKKGVPLADLRVGLESAQQQYIKDIFYGSKEDWGESYYEKRLIAGQINAGFSLPFKWSLGTYPEMYRILREFLNRDFPGDDRNPLILETINRVFYYDSIAVCDSFLLEFLQQMGLSLDHIPHEFESDKTEFLYILKEDLALLQEQAQAIAGGSLNDPILEKKVPGILGAAFTSMTEKLTEIITQVSHAGSSLAAAATQLSVTTEQMGNAIAEIAINAENASGIIEKTLDKTKNAKGTIGQLGDSSLNIGEVVDAIRRITNETKVLALNATIEAARAAGDAGRGFAVVAQQVKELSNATASATTDISKTVDSIQVDAQTTVGGIRDIKINIEKLSDVSTLILSSVNQQTLATKNTVQATSELSKMAEELHEIVSFFKIK
ncbi:hypothetical protein SCG7086_AP_00090 [Chlamydiales bacterium SCGC AG-110-P3]|nr:hypothetical protein SCG7086_AP_00090 [Chlamydiales bacterium SCGC AG-110-P3]